MPLTAEHLYNSYRASLLKYLIGLLPGGRQDALEILHETYIRLLQQEDLERIQQNPRAYIFTIATNLVTDWLRRRNSRRLDFHDSFDELEFPCDEMTPTRALNWEQSVAQLKQALMGLPLLTRQIFLLSRFDELTYPEIARELNVSTRTVERHMSNAFQALQHSLEDFL
jgi:RNA polymerase sigma factor (sigma-70 family)